MNWYITAALSLFGALVGYVIHAAQSFREQKQQAYKEILPSIVQMVYDRERADDAAYNRALLNLWLYGSKRVADKMDRLFIIHGSQPGDRVKALQEIIVAMRSDIQLWPWWPFSLKPEDVHHLYTRITKQQTDTDQSPR